MSFELKKICATVGAIAEAEALAVGEIIKGQIILAALITIIPLGLMLFGGEPPARKKDKK